LLKGCRRFGYRQESAKANEARAESRCVEHAIGDDGLCPLRERFAGDFMSVRMKRHGNACALNTSPRLIGLSRKRLDREFNVVTRRRFSDVNVVPERSLQHGAAKRSGLVGDAGEYAWIRLTWEVRLEK
jgi:hypothetical protein